MSTIRLSSTSLRWQHRQGFSLIELLVVISIIAILAGLLVPAIAVAIKRAHMTEHGNNGRQIVTMLRAYADENGSWPMLAAHQADGVDLSSDEVQRQVTIGSFAVLQMAFPEDIKSSLFAAPGQAEPEIWPNETNTEAWGWGNKPNKRIAYAFDWSASLNPGANRILIGDRDETTIDRHQALVVFGDAHFEYLDVTDTPPTAPEGAPSAPDSAGNGGQTGTASTKTILNSNNAWGAYYTKAGFYDDNIWSNANDGVEGFTDANMLDPQRGHPRRVFLK